MKFNQVVFASISSTALLFGAFGLASQEAKAEYYNTNRIGNSTYTYGSDGSSYNTNRIGNSTFYNGRTSDGDHYSGSCTTIGSSTFCN